MPVVEQELHAAVGAEVEHHEVSILDPDVGIAVLTYVTFFLLLAVLYKFAWKPILSGLDTREERIRKSLEDARKAAEEFSRINETSRKLIAETDEKAKHIVDRARKAAHEAARVIEHKAREEAKVVLGNATHEIEAMKGKARMMLREESVNTAIALAGRIIRQDLDEKGHQKLMDELIKEFRIDE
jgi:F-type H+-transporting ATPase subunit b